MTRKTLKPPKLSKRKNGQAYCTINKKQVYLGMYGTPEAIQAYQAIVAEFSEVKTVARNINNSTITVDELFLLYAEKLKKEGGKNSKMNYLKLIVEVVSPLYGSIIADKFRSIALKTIQQKLSKRKKQNSNETLSRRYVNDIISFIIQIFKFGVSIEKVQEETWRVLSTVERLKPGEARESARRLNVHTAVVTDTLPYLSSVVADMVRFQLATACRPGELFILRKKDLQTMGNATVYVPASNKNAWRGINRYIVLPPEAMAIIEHRGAGKRPEEYVFNPLDAFIERWEKQAAERKTPMTPSQNKRHQQNVRRRKRLCQQYYQRSSYLTAIKRGIERANADGKDVQHWTPYQLRHEALTNIQTKYGIEVAQAVAGHKSIDTTQIYVHNQIEMASRILED